MRYRDLSPTRRRQIGYGAVAALVVVLAAGLILIAHRVDPPMVSAPAADPADRRTAAGRNRQAAPEARASSGEEIAVVNGLRRDEAVTLIGEARRQAAAGNDIEAEALLKRADKAVPDLPETRQARDDIARLKTPEGQFANDIRRARLAVDHDDGAAAEVALAEAARLRPDAPEIAELRAALQAAHDKKARRETRVADALARMREAIARRDLAAANSALNEAERMDVQDDTIRQARSELARAQDAPGK